MVDPLVRQTALESLLSHHKEITQEQLDQSLKLGLTDPDAQINEIAWGFVVKFKLMNQYKKEISGFVGRLKKEGDGYSVQLADKILDVMKKVMEIKV